MSKIKKWWETWAPVWELMENRHMDTEIIENNINEILNPVLIIGAGQGLIVKYLRDKGYIADGIDIEEEMIKYAKMRHHIDIIKADASKLPFNDNSYKTVIISSGVVDYIEDEKLIKKIINEALRITKPNGNIFIAFYQLNNTIEKLYKNIGVIDSNNNLFIKRMFEIEKLVKINVFKPLELIQKWTNKNMYYLLFYWGILGLTFPKELKEDKKKIDSIFEKAKKMNINPQLLYDYIPEKTPYRTYQQIKDLFNRLGVEYESANRYTDCSLVKIYKSIAYDLKIKKREKNNKQWIIKTENISKKYKGSKKNAINSINIEISKGTIFGLLGPNGAGKTTTLSILSGLMKQTQGNVHFRNYKSKKEIKKIIGIVPQELALYPILSGRENLYFFGRIYNIKKDELNKRIEHLLDFVKLSDRADEIVKKYSSGMKRRLNLAIGLINNPEIIFMDEPTVGIDPQSRNCIFEAILNLKKNGTTIVYTTHYMEEADRLCDYIAIIDNGKIIIEGSPLKLVNDYGFNHMTFKADTKYSIEFLNALKEIGSVFDITFKNKNLFILSLNKNNIKTIDDINKLSKKFKTDLSLINISEPNLESLFLDITGRNLRDNV